MDSISTISFAIQPFDGTNAVVPVLNGTSLIELVRTYELQRGFDVAGGYGGLIPQYFNYGPLDRYFLGDFGPGDYFADSRGIYLLGKSSPR
jgi:hypothetical protein